MLRRDTQRTNRSDETYPEWWTSIGQGPSYGTDLDLNTHVNADIGTASLASLLQIQVNSQGTSLIECDEKNFSDKSLSLTIRGKDSSQPGSKWTSIDIVEKGSSNNPQILRTLGVVSYVKWVLPIRICYAFDSKNPDPTSVPAEFQITSQIIAHLNKVFSQACVEFYADSRSGLMDVHYDGWLDENEEIHDLDGAVTFDTPDLSGPELSKFTQLYLDKKMPTLFVVYDLHGLHGSARGFNVTDSGQKTCWTFVSVTGAYGSARAYNLNRIDCYLNNCAHEIGHALNISSRNYIPNPTMDQSPYGHDNAVLPLRYDATTLMYDRPRGDSKSYWIRNEDWDLANQKAQALSKALNQ